MHRFLSNQAILLYEELMTPNWLYKYLTISGISLPKWLEIPAGNADERLIQAELIAPNVLTATDDVVVTLTVAMATVLADSSDHDPIFGISDGTSFVGFQVVDQSNYADHAPCFITEGDITPTTFNNRFRDISGTIVTSRHFSSEIKIRLKPADQWGSCHTEHDEGTVNIANYQRKLDLTKGLYFEMYRDNDANEKYRIKYVEADINLN